MTTSTHPTTTIPSSPYSIGKEIALSLARIPGVHVIGTARREESGREAQADILRALESSSPSPSSPSPASSSTSSPASSIEFRTLDVTDPDSVARFASSLPPRVSVLVNNAGLAYKGDLFGPAEARATLATNLHGTARVTDALLARLRAAAADPVSTTAVCPAPAPHLPAAPAGGAGEGSAEGGGGGGGGKGAAGAVAAAAVAANPLAPAGPLRPRIINVCSQAGRLAQVSPALQARFQDPSASLASISALAEEFVGSVADGTYADKGWPRSMYGACQGGAGGRERMAVVAWQSPLTHSSPPPPSPRRRLQARRGGLHLLSREGP
jgi:NAD(P)-dependent dehydrogenase (short-subunit alcohol dehydrogenase family)